jgi:hypothetical protein
MVATRKKPLCRWWTEEQFLFEAAKRLAPAGYCIGSHMKLGLVWMQTAQHHEGRKRLFWQEAVRSLGVCVNPCSGLCAYALCFDQINVLQAWKNRIHNKHTASIEPCKRRTTHPSDS